MESNSPLKLDTAAPDYTPATPPIAAAFLVNFDHRKGYVLQWHRSIEGLNIEGVVELKSLPSGLHNVEEDVVYFVHEEYVGVSAYLNKPDSQAARNANMLAVGVLVPLQQGRIGKAWLHVDGLKALARWVTSPTHSLPIFY
jgi:DENN domain-containing protein 11